MILYGLHNSEAMRIINCQGCQYLGRAGQNGCCNYCIISGRMRPNKFGIENCSVKVLEDKPELIEKVVQKTLKDRDRINANLAKYAPKWDVAKAKRMFDDGCSALEIADAVCVRAQTIYDYIRKHNWRR